MFHSENLDSIIARLSSDHEDDAGVEKQAEQDTTQSDVSSDLETLLSKEASDNTEDNGEDNDMNKQAEEAGHKLASRILAGMNKEAVDGVAKNQELVDQQAAEEMPTPQGTVEQVTKGIVERAAAHGAVSEDELADKATEGKDATNSSTVAASSPNDPADDRVKKASDASMAKAAAVSELVAKGYGFAKAAEMVDRTMAEMEDEHEKAAAVDHLISEGYSSEDAVALVKAAAAEMQQEATGQVKKASVSDYVSQGYSFDQAVEMLKTASDKDEVTEQEKVAAFNAFCQGGLDYDNARLAVEILSQS